MLNNFNINIPKGLYKTRVLKNTKNYASDLVNFIPTTSGLKLRRGNIILNRDEEYKYIAGFKNYLVVMFYNNGVKVLNTNTLMVENAISRNIAIPINYIETNNRLILFYANKIPAEFFVNNLGEYVLQDITLRGDELDFVNFSSAVRYRERLYYFKEGDNRLFYTSALMYQGDLNKLDVSGIFNTRGNLIVADIIGFSAGIGLQSHLAVCFDSGDILFFDGTNPADPQNFRAVTAYNLGFKIYNQAVRVGQELYILTDKGLISLAILAKGGNTDLANSINKPIEDANLDYSKLKLYYMNQNLIIGQKNQANNYFYSFSTGGFYILDGINFEYPVFVNNGTYFLQNNILYMANQGVVDQFVNIDGEIEEKQIEGKLITAFFDFGTPNNKIARFINLDLNQNGGEYSVFAFVSSNQNINNTTAVKLPMQIYSLGTPWELVDEKLWELGAEKYCFLGLSLNPYNTIKIPMQGMGRTISLGIKVVGKRVEEFTLGGCYLIAQVANV